MRDPVGIDNLLNRPPDYIRYFIENEKGEWLASLGSGKIWTVDPFEALMFEKNNGANWKGIWNGLYSDTESGFISYCQREALLEKPGSYLTLQEQNFWVEKTSLVRISKGYGQFIVFHNQKSGYKSDNFREYLQKNDRCTNDPDTLLTN